MPLPLAQPHSSKARPLPLKGDRSPESTYGCTSGKKVLRKAGLASQGLAAGS